MPLLDIWIMLTLLMCVWTVALGIAGGAITVLKSCWLTNAETLLINKETQTPMSCLPRKYLQKRVNDTYPPTRDQSMPFSH
jgi:hypothetical protein